MLDKKSVSRYYTSLVCKLFILGHSTQGESIVMLLCDGDSVIYSCVVDSFVAEDQIIPKVLLQGMGITRITDLFWTHPHDDHSNGIIELIDEFAPEHIYISSELHSLPSNIDTVSSRVLEKINQINGYDRRRNTQTKVVGVATNYLVHNELLKVKPPKESVIQVPFYIYAVAPSSGKVRKHVIDRNYNSLNDFSVVLSVLIGDCSILLTGDIQNRMIGYVYDDLCTEIPVPNILKIPHHGSKDSTQIFKLFSGEYGVDVGVTTAKKSSNLPRNEAMSIYKSKCDYLYAIDSESTECAVWGVEIDILQGAMTELVSKAYLPYTE